MGDLPDVLETAGYQPIWSAPAVCCGLTWISMGELDTERRILGRSVGLLIEEVRPGTPVVGIDPSCTAVLWYDASELLRSPEACEVGATTRLFAELLAEAPDWSPPLLEFLGPSPSLIATSTR